MWKGSSGFWEIKSSYRDRLEDISSKHFRPPGPCDLPGKISKIIRTGDFCSHQSFRGTWYCRSRQFGVGRRGSPRFVLISPFSSDLFRFALLVFGNTPICSDLFRFLPISFQNKSEQIRETPFCRPQLQIPDTGMRISSPWGCNKFPEICAFMPAGASE